MTDTTLNKSYFYNEEPGWGNRSYFTFFSEFNRPWIGVPYIEAVTYIILFIISMIVNIWIFYQIVNTKSIRTVTNYFICNLASADIFFTLTGPFISVQRILGTWVLGGFFCHVMVFSLFVSGFVIIWTMTMISIDRYICINRPSTRKITPKMAAIAIIVIWILALTTSSPIAMYFVIRQFQYGSSEVKVCTLVWPVTAIRVSTIFTAILCVFGFIIPLGILAVNYFLIIKRFVQSKRAIANIKTNSAITKKRQKELRDFQVIQTLVLIVILFIVMWLPLFVVFVLIQLDGMHDRMKISSQMFIGTLAVALCNGLVNPFVYGIRNYRIKKAALRCLFCRKGHRRVKPMEPEQSQSVYALSYSQNSNSYY